MNGGEIKRARLALGLTQKDLATQLGTSPSKISRWESGAASIPADDLNQLQGILQLTGGPGDDAGTTTEPVSYRGRPRSRTTSTADPSNPAPTASFTGLNSRVDLVDLLSFLFSCSTEDAEILVRLAIDDGPISLRATMETAIISLAMVAKNLVHTPSMPRESYPVYMEHAAYTLPPHPSHHAPRHPTQHASGDEQGLLPLGVPVGIPETLLRFSFANNRMAVPAVGGPNHERAAMVVISNLAYQIWSASGDVAF